MELLDLYTETGEQTENTETRKNIHKLGLWHKTAQLWILNSKNELLLQFRSPHKDCFPSCWDVSSAGHIPAGESSINSAVRELEEELGLQATVNDIEHIFSIKESFTCKRTGAVDNEIADVFLLRRDVESSELNFSDQEVVDVKWVNVNKLWQEYINNRQDFVPHDDHFLKLISLLS